jgi:hypothetical protein
MANEPPVQPGHNFTGALAAPATVNPLILLREG